MAIGDNNIRRGNGRRGHMLAVAVSAEMVYQLVGSNMSSPQTAELNASARAPTIKKWVDLTNAEATAWIILLTILDGSLWPVFGGGLALGGMYFKYKYAIQAGLNNPAPATENYNGHSKGGRKRAPV